MKTMRHLAIAAVVTLLLVLADWGWLAYSSKATTACVVGLHTDGEL